MQSAHVYGTDWCGLTAGIRQYLTEVGGPAIYHNIEQEPEAEQAVLAMNNGKRKFPMVVVGEQTMKNPSRELLARVLKDQGLMGTAAE